MFAINQATGLVLAGTARTVADAASVATVRPSLCIIAALASLHSALSLSLTPAKDVSVADFVSATVSAVALLESADALLRLTLRSRTTGSLAWKVGFLLLQLPAAMPLIELLVIFAVLGPLSVRLYAGERGLFEKPHFGANLSLLSLHALIMTWSRATDAWEKAAARWVWRTAIGYEEVNLVVAATVRLTWILGAPLSAWLCLGRIGWAPRQHGKTSNLDSTQPMSPNTFVTV